MRRGKLDDDVKRKVKVNKDGRGRMGERKIKKKIRREKWDAWTERRKELVHGRWDETGWDEMIVLHVARARTDSINIRRSLGKTLALRCGLPLLLSFIFRMQCLPLPTHLYRDSLILSGKRRRLVILYLFSRFAHFPIRWLDQQNIGEHCLVERSLPDWTVNAWSWSRVSCIL